MTQLLLDDGTRIEGKPFGALVSVSGEVVFNTAMTGYPESLTDPSYKGQILVLTYPLIGNYGVPGRAIQENLSKYFESDHIHISGLVISSYSAEYSHWNALENLSDWLLAHNVPGISGVDTRAIVKILREHGTMLGKIVQNKGEDVDFYDPNKENLVAQVSVKKKMIYPGNEFRIILVDCGVKNNIIRCLMATGATVIRVPWDYDFTQDDFDGVVVSNGPGDPQLCMETIRNLETAISIGKPIFGICLGNQLLAIAAGASTYKLKYGHRGYNQPVLLCGSEKTYITSQNHGYAVDESNLGKDWEPYFINLNDGTNEGIIHKTQPFFSTQFHPEASGGPTDTKFLFVDFMDMVKDHKLQNK
ncbi:MAG: glutamine-hydrolyzing carbamoyl-phosphate synthase small subunit [Bacteroidetes bacterium]|nr:glutamine-hydrolyzing carbamoyl-phosphate synthase small subunit [Bacteroidota bacterium]